MYTVNRHIKLSLLSFALLCNANVAVAMEPEFEPEFEPEPAETEQHSHAHSSSSNPNSLHYEFSFSYAQSDLDTERATAALLDSEADHYELGFNAIRPWNTYGDAWLFGAAIGFYSYDDNGGFSQLVRDEYDGSIRRLSSDAGATAVDVSGGYRFSAAPRLSLDFLLGYRHLFSSERSISNCENCAEEDIDIDGGTYVSPRATLWFSQFGIGAYYQHGLSGDIENSVGVTFRMRTH